MREFNYRFDKGLMNGLRPTEHVPLNYQCLTELSNLKAGPAGIEPMTTVYRVHNSMSSAYFPYAQLFVGSTYAFIAFRNRVYRVTADLKTILDAVNGGKDPTYVYDLRTSADYIDTTAASYQWQLADYGKYFVMSNGTTVVYTDLTSLSNPILAKSTALSPTCRSYCSFRGQLIGAGVTSSWYDCGLNSIVWSKIGSNDMTPSISRESGFRTTMEWQGEVYKVLPLDKKVIVYGTGGILSMYPADVTFGFDQFFNHGLLGRYAVAGDDNEHVFADNNGTLWRLGRDGKPVELGYKEFINPLGAAAVISKDSVNNEYYISDGSDTYILTNNGLSHASKGVGSVLAYSDVVLGATTDGIYTYGLIETGPLDIKVAGSKTIVSVELGVNKTSGVSVLIKWKLPGDTTYRLTGWYNVNNEGVAYPKITAPEFKIVVKVDDPSDFKLSYINVRMNLTDRRSVRGVLDVNEING